MNKQFYIKYFLFIYIFLIKQKKPYELNDVPL